MSGNIGPVELLVLVLIVALAAYGAWRLLQRR